MTAMKKKRNAFTLVELLVVIAILAILATVSVIGYTAFVNRANESNALSEMTQARDLIRAELMDGEVHTYDMGTSETTDDVTLQLTDSGLKVTASKETTVNLRDVLTDLAELGGTFENIAVAENPADLGNYSATVNIITYTLESGEATAEWNIIEDTITTNS